MNDEKNYVKKTQRKVWWQAKDDVVDGVK